MFPAGKMMIFADIKQIIEPTVRLPENTSDASDAIKITIKETKAQAKCRKIELTGFQKGKIVSFSLDAKHKISEYINKSCKDITKGCDAVIFAEIKNKNYILICELKSDDPKGCDKQFISSSCFVDYIDSILKKFYGKNFSDFVLEYILFTTKKFNKRATSVKAKNYVDFGNLKVLVEPCSCNDSENKKDIRAVLKL